MASNTINLFMWGYQQHFRSRLGSRAKGVLQSLGIPLIPKVLLVGTRRPGSDDRNAVCVEPEDGEWPVTMFDGLVESVEKVIARHPLQSMFYGDEPSMREKPERIRRDSVREAVKRTLAPFDTAKRVRSFCGMACLVDQFYVVPVVQLPEEVFDAFPPLREPIGDDRISGHPSFIHASMAFLLSEAADELQRKDPGRDFGQRTRSSEEIVRHAAANFMKTPGVAIGDRNFYFDLFEQFNVISSLLYEGARGEGRLLLVNPENPVVEWALRLAEPVPFRESRWARKVLQMATTDIALIGDCECIYGLGMIDEKHDPTLQDVFTIDFLDHYHWQLRCGEQVLLRSRYGEPTLPQELIGRDRFVDNYSRLFPDATSDDAEHFWQLFLVAAAQVHGSMIVVADDATDEAYRLSQQGTVVQTTLMTEDLLKRVSDIDGTIILDPHGVCHAIGVILDGPASPECTPSRGSRFNSGIRYVGAANKPRLAIVVSDDHIVDIIPLLRPRIARREIEVAISALEAATLDNYHQSRNWLDEYRFYLNDSECSRVNTALDRIENLPKDVGRIVIITERFKPNPVMNESYFLPGAPFASYSRELNREAPSDK